MDLNTTLVKLAEELLPQMTAQRRDFHKYAEAGWFEMRTSSIIARKLTDLGYEVLTGEDVCLKEARMGVPSEEKLDARYEKALEQGADPEFLPRTRGGMTGVIGILRCGEGPTVAMRFDIDALGVVEATEPEHRPAREGWASVNPGFMHACGHDGHASIGLGVAQVLMAVRDQLHGTVKLIFQPAEEGVRGAKSIVEKGHLDNVDFFLGQHISAVLPSAPNTKVAAGIYSSLATTKLDVTYRGRSAHAASPNSGKNALQAAACAVMNLYAIPRHGGGATRINVGTLHAGSGRNVIADTAVMELEIRGANTQINEYMTECATRVLESAAQMYDCTCEIRLMGAAEALCSDKSLADRVEQMCAAIGVPAVPSYPGGGSEDVSYMMNKVQSQGGQAVFFRSLTKIDGGAHNRCYDMEESVLSTGVKVFCAVTADLMSELPNRD